jgi:hypothetical protein
MGIFCVCVICKKTVDFNRIKDSSEYMICERCMNSLPDHVPDEQAYHWLKRNKAKVTKFLLN